MNYAKADTGKRIVAAIIDAVLATVVYLVIVFTVGLIPVLGWIIRIAAGLALVAFYAFRDALPIKELDGASPGKKLLGLKAVTATGANCDYEASFKRNIPFVVPSLISLVASMIPFAGIILSMLVSVLALVIYIIELVKVLTDAKGLRIGDMLASTMVIEVPKQPVAQAPQAPLPPVPGASSASEVPLPPPPAPATKTPEPDPSEEPKA